MLFAFALFAPKTAAEKEKSGVVCVRIIPALCCLVGGRGREGVGVGNVSEMGRTEHQDIQLNFL